MYKKVNWKEKVITPQKNKLKRNTHKIFDKTLLKQLLNSTTVKPAIFQQWKKSN